MVSDRIGAMPTVRCSGKKEQGENRETKGAHERRGKRLAKGKCVQTCPTSPWFSRPFFLFFLISLFFFPLGSRSCLAPARFASFFFPLGRTRVAALAAQALLFFQWGVVAFGALGCLRFARALCLSPFGSAPLSPTLGTALSPSVAAPRAAYVMRPPHSHFFFSTRPPRSIGASSLFCHWVWLPTFCRRPFFLFSFSFFNLIIKKDKKRRKP